MFGFIHSTVVLSPYIYILHPMLMWLDKTTWIILRWTEHIICYNIHSVISRRKCWIKFSKCLFNYCLFYIMLKSFLLHYYCTSPDPLIYIYPQDDLYEILWENIIHFHMFMIQSQWWEKKSRSIFERNITNLFIEVKLVTKANFSYKFCDEKNKKVVFSKCKQM